MVDSIDHILEEVDLAVYQGPTQLTLRKIVRWTHVQIVKNPFNMFYIMDIGSDFALETFFHQTLARYNIFDKYLGSNSAGGSRTPRINYDLNRGAIHLSRNARAVRSAVISMLETQGSCYFTVALHEKRSKASAEYNSTLQ